VVPVDLEMLANATTFEAVAFFGEGDDLAAVRKALAGRDGAILPLLTSPGDVARLQLERQVCIDTTAAGGNASLMAEAG
jgi:RHH-type proline utilization regulon transcriptional repressor/proline dehydrogenase/delta 1-pyrroline-5-carboxylate dehydrogenase